MSGDAKKAIEALFYETDIPEDEDYKKARETLISLVKGWTGGKNLSGNDALYKFELEATRAGFLCGFQRAARMGELLKEASL